MDAASAFIGGSYKSQSPLADCEELINWYKEDIQSPAASAKSVLYPTPGVSAIANIEYGVGRAHLETLGREFAVVGPSFVEIKRNGSHTVHGTVALDSNPATLCSSGDLSREVFITSGGNGYIFNLDTSAFAAVALLAGKATMGAYLDGYFFALDSARSAVYSSVLGDGTTWDPTTYWIQRSAAGDRWVSMKVAGRFMYLLGEITSEIWYDAGGVPFPLGFYSGAPLIQYGCLAPYSPAVIGDSLIWVARSPAGRRCIVKANLQAQQISTYPIDVALEQYPDATKAIGDAYSDRGHTFYLIGFDDSTVTWAFDNDTGEWAKRGTWDKETGQWESWRPRFYANAFGEHRMLDGKGRSVFQMSADYATDANGDPIRRLRRTPALTSGNDRIFYSSLELFFETGLRSIPATRPFAEFTWTFAETTTVDATASTTPVGSITSYSWYLNDVIETTLSTPTYDFGRQLDEHDVIKLVITAPTGTAAASASFPTWPLSLGATGTSTPLGASGASEREPQIMLKLSNDAGRTWVTEQWRGAGKLGEYQRRVRWNGLGSARRRVFEVSCADDYPWRLIGADLRISQAQPTGENDNG